MITVVYDSSEAEIAAKSLYNSLSVKGQYILLMDSDRYMAEKRIPGNADQTIIIGHDLLAEKEIRQIPAFEYDIFGMRYGFNGNICVISAQKNLNFREQSEFLKFADSRRPVYGDQNFNVLCEINNAIDREDDMDTAVKEFVSDMKDWYRDGDGSVSGTVVKGALIVAFSPLAALVGIGSLLATACQAGSAAIDRRGILEAQYYLLFLEFEAHGIQRFQRFQGQTADGRQMNTANITGITVEPRAGASLTRPMSIPPKFKPPVRSGHSATLSRPVVIPALDELDKLVGLEDVKKTVREIVTFLQKRGKNAVPCLHMVFRGNPGTAKTTVARIIARIFAESGIINKNLIVETDRAGLIGGYVGQTALKTERQIKKSLGGVLFIDEAYALFSDDSQDYGNEAVATLVKAMEDNRDRFVCILAGYPDEMDKMIDMNPGLRHRVQFYIDFPDYTDAELMGIFEGFCENKRYELSKSARAAVSAAFSRLVRAKDKHFSNGRLVRKVFERICIKQAQRTDDSIITEEDVTAAFAESDIASMRKSRVKIGFAAEE
jgi:AAA+ superfamily predicted ATPase